MPQVAVTSMLRKTAKLAVKFNILVFTENISSDLSIVETLCRSKCCKAKIPERYFKGSENELLERYAARLPSGDENSGSV
jgi:hypothetical protein